MRRATGTAIVAIAALTLLSLPVNAQSPSCYVQALTGGTVATAKASDGIGDSVTLAADGLALAAGIGCDLRIDHRFVVGVVARYEIARIQSDVGSERLSQDATWTAAFRAGYLVNSSVLAYGLVGMSGTDFRISGTSLDSRGLVLGGGLEIDLIRGFSLTVEYTNTRMSGWHIDSTTIDPVAHSGRVGISYRFNSLFGDK